MCVCVCARMRVCVCVLVCLFECVLHLDIAAVVCAARLRERVKDGVDERERK